jgi:hypothetical protein
MKKRSKYRPKGIIADPLSWVLSGMKTVSKVPEAGLNLTIKNHSALESAVKGVATKHEIDVLVGAINVAEALCIMGIGEDWLQEVLAASNALHSMASRGVSENHFIFTGLEMTAVKMAMEIHDVQLENCTVKQLEKAVDIVNKTVAAGKARKIEDGVPQV